MCRSTRPRAGRLVAVPLKCFGQSGADMKRIRTSLSLRTAGSLDIAVQRVALGTEADQKIACTS
ncbi:MAG: putative glycoside hydrolase [Gammaproteobacteria bacterium]